MLCRKVVNIAVSETWFTVQQMSQKTEAVPVAATFKEVVHCAATLGEGYTQKTLWLTEKGPWGIAIKINRTDYGLRL